MKLQEIFDQLSIGELSQLSIGGEAQGAITESNYSRVLAYINLGLTALARRFNLRTGSVRVVLQPGQNSYVLASQYLISNLKSQEPVKYLEEIPGIKFIDAVLKIEQVRCDSGIDLVLNDYTQPWAVSTPSVKTLRVPTDIVEQSPKLPEALKTQTLEVTYRAGLEHLVVPLGYFDPARVEVPLPDAYLEALLYFVAARAHAPIGMQEEGAAGNTWFTKFENECQRLEQQNLQIDLGASSPRFVQGGWC